MSEGFEQVREAQPRRFRPYPAYKDSAVEWLGEIPADWKVDRLKYLGTVNDEALPESTNPGFMMAYVDISSVDAVEGITATEDLVFEKAPSRARRIVQDGDVIVSTVRTYLRAIASVENPEPNLIVSTGFAVIRPRQIEGSFASYALRAPYFVERVVANSVGVSYPAINASDLACFPVAYPTPDEQRAIVAFLDRETAKIDGLVKSKERLIELLQEKRTALITRAVTRGLDPDVPMKDSGVEWLGEIPAHWEVKRVGQLLTERPRNGLSPAIGPDGTTPTFSTAAVNDGVVAIEGNVKYTSIGSSKARAYLVLQGDVLLLRGSGSRSLVGKAGIVIDRPPEGCIYPDILIRVRPGQALAPWFLVKCLNSAAVRPQIEAAAKTAAGIWKITSDDIRCLVIPVPPYPEQRRLQTEISRILSKIDAAVAGINDAVDYLRECRTALISAAVTGKIDVREEAS